MTALKEYDRLEAAGLWRAAPDAQRRDVIVSLGDATLTISDLRGTALTHWSLAAIRRDGTGSPVLFHPDGDRGETLELASDETVMIEGIDRLMRSIERRRPRPGYLRLLGGLALGAALSAAAALWLPDALRSYAVRIVPEVKREEIGAALLTRMTRITGQPCLAGSARAPLQRLAERVLGPEGRNAVFVLRDGVRESAHLPGGIVLLDREVVEGHEDVDVPAGYILAERERAGMRDPLATLLDQAGLMASLRLLTTGALPPETLDAHAEALLLRAPVEVDPERLLDAFDEAGLRSAPYARAVDVTAERTTALIESDPHAGRNGRDVLSDADWVRLQGICGG